MNRGATLGRVEALHALGEVLRGDPSARWPTDGATWEAFLELASSHALLPAVWSAWRHAGRPAVPGDVAAALEQAAPTGTTVPDVVLQRAYDANVARTARLLDVAGDVLARLEAAAVTAVPLKGLHMQLAGVWPDPAARTMADLDLLVPAARAPDAYTALRESYEEHPDPIGEHADHHLPMVRRDDVTIELHTELLVSRWRALAPAPDVLARARRRDTALGPVLLASATDTLVHLVAHAQLQDDTYRLLGVPLRALFETARWLDGRNDVDVREVRERFAAAGVGHVLDAHLDAAHRWFGGPAAPTHAGLRARAHTVGVEAGVASPGALGAWDYLVRVPQSFTAARMLDEFGPPEGATGPVGGPAWLWRARARHAARHARLRLRLDRGT